MPTLIADPVPSEVQAFIERRRALGLDRRDEVWEGVRHMNPPPSYEHERALALLIRVLGPYADAAGLEIAAGAGIGSADDNRVPDLALYRPGASGQWQPTAALAVEIVSPGDQTWHKLPFYAEHAVEELLIVDRERQGLNWLALRVDGYEPVQRSALIELDQRQLGEQLGWGQQPR